jgi:hypothetical protein
LALVRAVPSYLQLMFHWRYSLRGTVLLAQGRQTSVDLALLCTQAQTVCVAAVSTAFPTFVSCV